MKMNMKTQPMSLFVILCLPFLVLAGEIHSPFDVAWAPQGGLVAVSDYTAAAVVLIGTDGKMAKTIALKGQPAGLDWAPDGRRLYVAERGAGTLAEVDPAAGTVVNRLKVARYPIGVAVRADLLAVTDNGGNTLVIFDRASGAEKARIPCVYRPWDVALSPDGTLAVVSNLIPLGDARSPSQAAAVTLIDLVGLKTIADLPLPPGSINLHGVAISPDSRFAYVVHSIGRFTLPTTQIERGWVMTHGMSVIDLAARTVKATVLLDLATEGAADPWEIALSADGATAWISLAGISELAQLDLKSLHQLLDGKAPPEVMKRIQGGSIWAELAKTPAKAAKLSNDLAALAGAGLMKRITLPAQGTRGLACSVNGDLAVASYFSGEVMLLDPATLAVKTPVALGPSAAPSPEREGERLFFDARQCFQKWMSCASCHPEGRADGLNWDLLNDGMGNPKNTKSMTLAHRTPPSMATGIRENMEVATKKGFMVIQFRTIEEAQLEQVRAYIRSIPIEPSPYLLPTPGKTLACITCHPSLPVAQKPQGHRSIAGDLSPAAAKGLALFRDPKVGCATCHPGPLLTDLKMHDVGTGHERDRREDFDTPTCYELWRTAPFLHDGSAATVMDLLTTQNTKDRHGVTSHLSETERQALAAFLLSL